MFCESAKARAWYKKALYKQNRMCSIVTWLFSSLCLLCLFCTRWSGAFCCQQVVIFLGSSFSQKSPAKAVAAHLDSAWICQIVLDKSCGFFLRVSRVLVITNRRMAILRWPALDCFRKFGLGQTFVRRIRGGELQIYQQSRWLVKIHHTGSKIWGWLKGH